MAMLAHHLVEAGAARRILVVAGENRLTGQTRDAAIQTLAQVGHPIYEVPLGPTIPAYYGLVASRYMHEHGATEEDLAELAVLMRTPCAGSSRRAVPRSDYRCGRDGLEADRGAAEDPRLLSGLGRRRSLRGEPRAHRPDWRAYHRLGPDAHPSARRAPHRAWVISVRAPASSARAPSPASRSPTSATPPFTTASRSRSRSCWRRAVLLREAGRRARAGGPVRPDGELPLNTHGGLLSYGHCGVGGAMAHLVETYLQMTGAGAGQGRSHRHSPCCMATAASCPPMSASSLERER